MLFRKEVCSPHNVPIFTPDTGLYPVVLVFHIYFRHPIETGWISYEELACLRVEFVCFSVSISIGISYFGLTFPDCKVFRPFSLLSIFRPSSPSLVTSFWRIFMGWAFDDIMWSVENWGSEEYGDGV